MHDYRFAPNGSFYGLALGVGGLYTGYAAPLPQGIYKHLVATFDYGSPGYGKIYLDGVLVSNQTISNNSRGVSYFCLNNDPSYANHGWNGCMNEIRVYDYALNSKQIGSLYDKYLVKQ